MKKEERNEKERERNREKGEKGRKERKSTNSTCWRGYEEGGPPTLRWECELVRPLWRTAWRLLKELKKELPCDPAALLLGTYPDRTIVPKDA